MAATTGPIQALSLTGMVSDPQVCLAIGPSLDSAELFYLIFRSSDSEWLLAFKKSIVKLLVMARASRCKITVEHADTDAEILNVTVGGFDISPIDVAVHQDFYSITGSAIPSNVQIRFQSAGADIAIPPDFVRPHWVLVRRLPQIPVGLNRVRLESQGWSSDWVPIEVSAGPALKRRVLYPGAPTTKAYTILFAANPVIQDSTGNLRPDPIMVVQEDFQRTVDVSLTQLFTQAEDVLRRDVLDKHIRLLAVFDTTLPTTDANALVSEDDTNIISPRPSVADSFANRYFVKADVVFAVSGSTSHHRFSATGTIDDPNGPSTPFTADYLSNEEPFVFPRRHYHFRILPGAVALNQDMYPLTPTVLHEFLHAAGSVLITTNVVGDLYFDGHPSYEGILVNKRYRANLGDPVPGVFGSYNGTAFASDPNRDTIGYPATWQSYHGELIDATRSNIMDIANDPSCRLDRLTYEWMYDRLRAKVFRQ